MPALLAALRGLSAEALTFIATRLEGLGATAVGRSATGVYAGIRQLVARNPKTAKFIAESLAFVGISVGTNELLGDDAQDAEVRKSGQAVNSLRAGDRQRILDEMARYGSTLGEALAMHTGDGKADTIDGRPATEELAAYERMRGKVLLLREARKRTGMTWRELEYLRLILVAEPAVFTAAMTDDGL